MSKLVETSCDRLIKQMDNAIAECHKGLECLKDKSTPYAESIAYLIFVYERILNVIHEERDSGIEHPSKAYEEDLSGNGGTGCPDDYDGEPEREESDIEATEDHDRRALDP